MSLHGDEQVHACGLLAHSRLAKEAAPTEQLAIPPQKKSFGDCVMLAGLLFS